jgi:hypothetical protein
MQSKRKLQFIASAVILNGVLALTAMAPRVALANPCAPITACLPNTGVCGAALCAQLAQPGCTNTSHTCQVNAACTMIFPPIGILLTCNYN